MQRLSMFALLTTLLAGCVQQQAPLTAAIPRPAPDEATPTGIAYLCDGRREVTVVYAKNRASVTFEGKTWRMEYQPSETGFRYADGANEWAGRDELASLHELAGRRALAFNCRPVRRTT